MKIIIVAIALLIAPQVVSAQALPVSFPEGVTIANATPQQLADAVAAAIQANPGNAQAIATSVARAIAGLPNAKALATALATAIASSVPPGQVAAVIAASAAAAADAGNAGLASTMAAAAASTTPSQASAIAAAVAAAVPAVPRVVWSEGIRRQYMCTGTARANAVTCTKQPPCFWFT